MQQFDLFSNNKDAASEVAVSKKNEVLKHEPIKNNGVSLRDRADSTTGASSTSKNLIKVDGKVGKTHKRLLLKDETEFFDGELMLIKDFIAPDVARQLFSLFVNTLHWEQIQIRIYDKWQTIPRMQAWYGDAGAAYQYSGVMMEPQVWTTELQQLRKDCQSLCHRSFNSVLANLYRDGQDCMGFHSDDEKELGRDPVIASLTLGSSRNFDLVHKKQPYKLRLPLQPGSLLVMKGETQKNWQHGITRTKQPVSPRVNLTFRQIRLI